VWPSQFSCYEYECYLTEGGDEGEGEVYYIYDCYGPCDGSMEDGDHSGTTWFHGDEEHEDGYWVNMEFWWWNENEGDCSDDPPDGGGGGDDGDGGGGTQPTIQVTCSPSNPVTRGTDVTCTASSTTGGTVVMSYWKFAPNQTDHPGLPDTIVRTTNVSSVSWSGTFVAGGMLKARGTVDGALANENQVGISVAKRVWRIPIDTIDSADAAQGLSNIAASKRRGLDTRFECEPRAHYAASLRGWTVVPGRCGVRSVIYPASDTLNNALVLFQIPSGPNEGLWHVQSLGTTKLYLRMQVLRDFRADATPYQVFTFDPIFSGCIDNNVFDLSGGSVTLGVADSSCMRSTGFKHFTDSLWQHERCHVRIASSVVSDTPFVARSLDSLEMLVRPSQDVLRDRAGFFLSAIDNNAVQYSDHIDDDLSAHQHPVYWGRNTNNTAWIQRFDSSRSRILTDTLCALTWPIR
jgi:hypothetical protein